MYPLNVSNLTAKAGNGKITLTWDDPQDTYDADGQLMVTWGATIVVRKTGSAPTSASDGTVVVTNTERGQYSTNGYVDSGLTNGTEYFYGVFPRSDSGVYNTNSANKTSKTPVPYKTMTVVIDTTNSNPSTCITYADDATGMTAGSSDWDEFFGHYPCLLKNGVEQGKLKTTDFSQFEDGTVADITSGDAGDVMIAFPRRGLKISTSGNYLTISMTDDPNNANFAYYAHQRGSTDKDVFYLGAYKGYSLSNKLRSLSGKTITVSQTIGSFRTLAQTNGAADGNGGSGYDQSGFYQLVFRQAMYLLKYKNLDSQSTVGKGYTGASSSASTGATNTNGMDYGTTSNTTRMKLFGLEDFWGNVYEWIDGLFCNNSRHILTATQGFNDTGSGYTDQGLGASSNLGNYISKVQGTSETGFIPKKVSGSASTYYCDYGELYAGYLPYFGGSWIDDYYAGAFYLDVSYGALSSSSRLGARLMYL